MTICELMKRWAFKVKEGCIMVCQKCTYCAYQGMLRIYRTYTYIWSLQCVTDVMKCATYASYHVTWCIEMKIMKCSRKYDILWVCKGAVPADLEKRCKETFPLYCALSTIKLILWIATLCLQHNNMDYFNTYFLYLYKNFELYL